MSRYQSISEDDLFDVEYWSLEQAKLGKGAEKPLARQVAVVTGGGSGIGAATAKAFAKQGAEVAVLDRDEEAAKRIAKQIGGAALAVACDVTNAEIRWPSVRRHGRGKFGGVDIVVSNAGAAWQGPHRRSGREDFAPILRAEFLRPSERGAARRENHEGARHRRVPPVQHLQAGGQPGQGFRALWPAESRDPVPGQAIRARSRQRRHPRQCGQCRPHPHRSLDGRHGGGAGRKRGACPRRIT